MSATPPTLPTALGYDQWSAVYDGDGNPLIALEERVVLPLLADVRGLRILDVGAGTGRHAIRLAQGGGQVTAIDFSTGMLRVARAKPGAERVTWVEHDLSTPFPLADGSFDLVLCALVLDHVKDVDAFFAQLARVCRPGGHVLITVMHPAMLLRGVQARFIDPASGERVLLESAPNQISDYVMGATRADLRIDAMSEHAVDAELIRTNPRAEKHAGWPLLLVMKLRRA